MGIKQIVEVLEKNTIVPGEKCPRCGSIHTEPDEYAECYFMEDGVAVENWNSDIPTQLIQHRICQECETQYTVYFDVEYDETVEDE